MLLQRALVRFPILHRDLLQLPVSFSPGGFSALSWPLWALQACAIHLNTLGKILIQIKHR